MKEVLKGYNSMGKGPSKDNVAFDFLINKEGGIVQNLKQLMLQEGQKNMHKLDNNLKMAQVDLDNMNNQKRLFDEKERIHLEKMKGLENENKQIDEELNELNELLTSKKRILNNMKKRNDQSKKNRKKIIELQKNENTEGNKINTVENLNESNDIGSKSNSSRTNPNNKNPNAMKKKKKKEAGCECFIF